MNEWLPNDGVQVFMITTVLATLPLIATKASINFAKQQPSGKCFATESVCEFLCGQL